MVVLVVVLVLLIGWGVAATARALRTDGHRRIPTLDRYDTRDPTP